MYCLRCPRSARLLAVVLLLVTPVMAATDMPSETEALKVFVGARVYTSPGSPPVPSTDFVILAGDPAVDTKAFARVVQTWRAGELIYDAHQ